MDRKLRRIVALKKSTQRLRQQVRELKDSVMRQQQATADLMRKETWIEMLLEMKAGEKARAA